MRPMVTWISGVVDTGETSFVFASAGFRPIEVEGAEATGLAAVIGWTLTGSTLRISTERGRFSGDPACSRATDGRIGSEETSFGFGRGDDGERGTTALVVWDVVRIAGVTGGTETRTSGPGGNAAGRSDFRSS